MAWQKIQFRLKSDGPMISHNGQTADPLNKFSKAIKQISGKRGKTDADCEDMARLEFLAGLYMGRDGPIIPADNIDACILNAAKKLKEGPVAKIGIFCTEHAKMEYVGPRDANELWLNETFRFTKGVRVGMARVMRTRPIFEDWSAVITLKFDDNVVNIERVKQWLDIAGAQIGLGDWRPQHGRYTVEVVE